MQNCYCVYFSGSVQGVGFRFTARGLAHDFSITGFVRNLPDGRVEVFAAGDKKEVLAYLDALRDNMREYIAQEEGSWTTCPENFVTFDIRF